MALRTMSDKAPKIAADNAMPRRSCFGVELGTVHQHHVRALNLNDTHLFLDVLGYIFFDVEQIHGLLGNFDGLTLHLFALTRFSHWHT